MNYNYGYMMQAAMADEKRENGRETASYAIRRVAPE